MQPFPPHLLSTRTLHRERAVITTHTIRISR